jgi:hypothetical protein
VAASGSTETTGSLHLFFSSSLVAAGVAIVGSRSAVSQSATRARQQRVRYRGRRCSPNRAT